MGRWCFAICLLMLLLTTIPSPCSCQEDERAEQVLYINSYDYGFSWSRLIADGVHDGISAPGSESVKPVAYIRTEFIDSKMIADETHFKNIYNLLSYKLKDNTPALIIVSDDNALRFIREYRDDLFPGVPVVFTGINDYDSLIKDLPDDYTGIVEKLPIEENIIFIQALQPGVKTVYLVTDDTYSGIAIREQAEGIAENYQNEIEIIYPSGVLSPGGMLAEVDELPDNSAILFATYNTPGIYSDKLYSDHYVKALLEQDRIPVYTMMSQYNYAPITGGCQVSPYELGRLAAETALEVVSGTDPVEIPVEMNTPYSAVLNYNHIEKYGIKKSDIPPGTKLLNEPSTTITIPANYAAGGVILLFSLISILIVSLVYSNRLKRKETELKDLLDENTMLLKEINHRVRNNMAVMSSLIGMQILNSEKDETKERLREIDHRIMSMSIAYDNISQYNYISKIDVHNLFINLGERLIQDYPLLADIDFEVNGEKCPILPCQAVPLSVAVNEIITNSLKFAFVGKTSGKIRIDHSCDGERLNIIISDDGRGIESSVIDGEPDTLGFYIIKDIVCLKLNGNAEVGNDSGTVWTISFPIDDN